jgi:hypothetical protein
MQRVLAQYFDLEHSRYVHPHTLGESRLVTCHGKVVWFEQRWPRRFGLGVRLRSFVKMELTAPNQARFHVVKGLGRGSQLDVVLDERDGQTSVDETYDVPLRLHPWLERMVQRWLAKKVDEVWEEDLRVGLPHGGWPGIPRDPRPGNCP